MVGLDCSIIMNPKVWEASGHVGSFNDPMVDCKGCKARFRADQVFTVIASQDGNVQLQVGVEADDAENAQARGLRRRQLQDAAAAGTERRKDRLDRLLAPTSAPKARRPSAPCAASELTEPRKFNMMFKTFVGAMEDSSSVAYLRPETAQGIFANYKNVLDTSRIKLPFGIAQIGKSFRNEINPRNFTFRSREFEQMEIEFFCHPNQADKWYEYWREARYNWYIEPGLEEREAAPARARQGRAGPLRQGCADVEYDFPSASPSWRASPTAPTSTSRSTRSSAART